MKPFLLYGETAQGFMTVQQQPNKRVVDTYEERIFTSVLLESYL